MYERGQPEQTNEEKGIEGGWGAGRNREVGHTIVPTLSSPSKYSEKGNFYSPFFRLRFGYELGIRISGP